MDPRDSAQHDAQHDAPYSAAQDAAASPAGGRRRRDRRAADDGQPTGYLRRDDADTRYSGGAHSTSGYSASSYSTGSYSNSGDATSGPVSDAPTRRARRESGALGGARHGDGGRGDTPSEHTGATRAARNGRAAHRGATSGEPAPAERPTRVDEVTTTGSRPRRDRSDRVEGTTAVGARSRADRSARVDETSIVSTRTSGDRPGRTGETSIVRASVGGGRSGRVDETSIVGTRTGGDRPARTGETSIVGTRMRGDRSGRLVESSGYPVPDRVVADRVVADGDDSPRSGLRRVDAGSRRPDQEREPGDRRSTTRLEREPAEERTELFGAPLAGVGAEPDSDRYAVPGRRAARRAAERTNREPVAAAQPEPEDEPRSRRRPAGGRRTAARTPESRIPEQRIPDPRIPDPRIPEPRVLEPRSAEPESESRSTQTSRRPLMAVRAGRDAEQPASPYTPAEPVRDAVLSTTDLVKVHGQGARSVVALDGISLDVGRGRFTAIMGASGSGKSTLLHCLAGLDKPTRGTVLLGTTDLTRVSERKLTRLRRDRIGFVFQSYDLLPQLTVKQNILLPIEVAGAKVDQPWMDTVLEALELGDLLRQLPSQLSGGEQQRVAVARAVLPRPDVVLADEPTGALDAGTTREMVGFLRASVDHLGQTVVMVTHDPLAAQHTDRAVILHDGRMVGEVGRPTAHGVLDALAALAESAAPAAGERRGAVPPRRAARRGFRWPSLRRRAARSL